VNKKTISTELTDQNIASVIALLTETPVRLETLSASLRDVQVHQPLGPGERSFTQVLAHLLNSEARSTEAIYLALLGDEPFIPDIHPERQWGKLLKLEQLPFSDLLSYFRLRRTILLRVLTSLTEAQWTRVIREQRKKRKESVYRLARSLALHEFEHLSDLRAKLVI
jgi:hypothetical protein